MKWLRTMGQVLESAEHEVRNVRCNPEHLENRPFNTINRIGRFVLFFTGDDRQ